MADGRTKNGGSRIGAGRKSRAEEDDLRKLLDQAWKKSDRKISVTKVAQRAAQGNLEAFKVLMAYAYGRPTQRVEVVDDDTRKDTTPSLDLSQLTDEELALLERLIAKSRRGASGEGTAQAT